MNIRTSIRVDAVRVGHDAAIREPLSASIRTNRRKSTFLPEELRVGVSGIAEHPVVHHSVRLGYSIAPKRLRMYHEVSDSAIGDPIEGECKGTPISVLTRDGGEAFPPSLSIPLYTAYRADQPHDVCDEKKYKP